LARVVFRPRARADFDKIFDWIAERGGVEVARAYSSRIERFCFVLTPFPQRGTARNDVRPGLRTIGFERRATIAFTVKGEDVIILRILYAGRSLDHAFDDLV
jgi:toxin ParE1/3/4